MIRLANGRTLYSASLSLIYKGLVGVKEAQIIQSQVDTFRLMVVLDRSVALPNTLAQLKDNLLFRIGAGASVTCESVDFIPRTANGKFRPVVSNVAQLPATTEG